tara:strand:+ start:550 stop:882 length:333 start_codon:yes stop_codon:yes gene_type:complete
MQGHTTLSSRKEPDIGSLNKGAELLLSNTTQPTLHNWRKQMEQAIIALSVMVGILTLGLGLTIGYLIRCYVQETTPQYSHPEMFDANGNPLPDELLAIRFEGDPHDNDDD